MQSFQPVALRRARKEKGLSQSELGKLAGMDQRQVSRIEKGQVPTSRTLLKIANALAVPMSLFFDD